jgi:hypothetical protein
MASVRSPCRIGLQVVMSKFVCRGCMHKLLFTTHYFLSLVNIDVTLVFSFAQLAVHLIDAIDHADFVYFFAYIAIETFSLLLYALQFFFFELI